MAGFCNKFHAGQVVHHKVFGYRGVVVGFDETFQLSEEWYDQVATSRPPKDQPWYHVLVHEASHTTYVAERNLETCDQEEGVEHPLLGEYFDKFSNGFYSNSQDEH